MANICYIGNVASHYRKSIFVKMSETFDIDFLFGDSLWDIKQMDTTLLHGKVIKTKLKYLVGGWHWHEGVLSLLKQPYEKYILISDSRSLSTWMFCIIARLFFRNKIIFFWSHGWYGKETRIESFLKKIYMRLPNGGIFLYGNYARSLMIKEGFNPDKLFTIHNSLDYNRQLDLRINLTGSLLFENHFGNNNRNLIFVGRLTKIKHLDLILDAMRLSKNDGVDYNLTLVGDGVMRPFLEEKTQELGLMDNVWFYGACYDEQQLSTLIYNADLCVSPGNVGLTAIHSLMFGTPVITHNDFKWQMPEFEAIRDNETGAFFEYNNSASLCLTINNWFCNHKNREIVRKNCYREIDNYWTPEFQISVLKQHIQD